MLNFTATTGVLGATASGLDLSAPGPDQIDALKKGLAQYLVVYVPDQNLDRFQLSALGRAFGPPFLHPEVDNGYDDCPEVLELRREPGDAAVFGGQSWHADVTWKSPAGHISILHGIEIPPVGGDTAFSSTIAAFDALSPGLQQTLRGLSAVHTYYWYERREDPGSTVVHPVVRTHPDTGREGLYINTMFTNRFQDMSVEESAPLLGFLFNHLQRHEFTCRFRWQTGGVILWDNRFTLHYPINDVVGGVRFMTRTTALETNG